MPSSFVETVRCHGQHQQQQQRISCEGTNQPPLLPPLLLLVPPPSSSPAWQRLGSQSGGGEFPNFLIF
jgi:hypothetical protein